MVNRYIIISMSDLRHIFKLAGGELQSTIEPSENYDDHIARLMRLFISNDASKLLSSPRVLQNLLIIFRAVIFYHSSQHVVVVLAITKTSHLLYNNSKVIIETFLQKLP